MNKTELCIGVASAQLRIFGSSVRPLFEVKSYQSLRHSAACDTFAKLLAIEERVGVQDGNHCKPCTLISSQSFHKVFVGGTAYHRYSDISLISVHTIDTAIHEDSSSKIYIYIYMCSKDLFHIFSQVLSQPTAASRAKVKAQISFTKKKNFCAKTEARAQHIFTLRTYESERSLQQGHLMGTGHGLTPCRQTLARRVQLNTESNADSST